MPDPRNALQHATRIGANPNAMPRSRPTAPDTAPRMYAPSWRERMTGAAQDVWDQTKDHPLVAIADLLGLTDRTATERSFTDPTYEPDLGQAVTPYRTLGARKLASREFLGEAQRFTDPTRRAAAMQFAERYPRVSSLMRLVRGPADPTASEYATGRVVQGVTEMMPFARRAADPTQQTQLLDVIQEHAAPGSLAAPTSSRASVYPIEEAVRAVGRRARRSYEQQAIPPYLGHLPDQPTARVTLPDRAMGTSSPHEAIGHEATHALDMNSDPLVILRAVAEKKQGVPYQSLTSERKAFRGGVNYAIRQQARETNAQTGQPALGARSDQWMSPFANQLATMNARDRTSLDALREATMMARPLSAPTTTAPWGARRPSDPVQQTLPTLGPRRATPDAERLTQETRDAVMDMILKALTGGV